MIQAGYNYVPTWDNEDVMEPRTERIVKKVVRKKANKRRKLLGRLGMGMFLYGLLLVFLCIKSASLGYQIVQLEKDISGLQTANDRIEYRIAQMTALPQIEAVAQNELNMYKPDKSIKIVVSNSAYSSSQGSSHVATVDESLTPQDNEGSSLEKLYLSLMQLADNN
ncbi:MAG: hypothetical protein GX119_00845 [Syntrophomonadaceae bacterium]|jgi:cell division protein FtsB|nr:hypothetical protein [Syntrophomonadaceae bacterium]